MHAENLSRIGLATRTVCLMIAALGMLSCDTGADSGSVQDIVLTNGLLIDGTGAGPTRGTVVVIRGGRIAQVGSEGEVEIPSGALLIDLDGRTILPGFFNAHVHRGLDREKLKAWAWAGVTTVRDLGGPSSFALRDEYAQDPTLARLVVAGPMVSVPGGYPLVPWGSPNMLPVNSPDDGRRKVRQLLTDGADIIKIAIESGESFGRPIPTLTVEEAAAIVETAHGHGTVVSAHVLVTSDLIRALAADADDIAHMVSNYLPDSVAQQVVAKGTFWEPTIELWKNVGQGLGEQAIANLRRFVAAGGAVALGTDYAGYDRPFELGMPISEMEWMLEAGMTTMQVIVAGTRNAARVCNRSHDLGTIEGEKIADVLVVEGDPLQDIRALLNVHMVIHNGVRIR